MKEMLYAKIERIKDAEIRRFVAAVLNNAPEGFWTTPCSGTGKWHPPENQGEGGLIRHLLKCAEFSQDLCRFFNLSENETDVVLASTILHDIKKNGEPWGQSTDLTHGKIGYDFLDKFNLREPEKTKIKNGVRYHLGRFTGTWEDRKRASNPNIYELIVQITDYACSRKYASWLPWVTLKQADIEKFERGLS